MKTASFLILAGTCLLALHLAVLPVAASPGGNATAVTISVSPAPEGSWFIGDTIRLSGTNTGSRTTYIYLTGPGLNPGGSLPDSSDMVLVPVTRGIVTSYKAVSVGTDHQWSWDWDTHRIPLISGAYTVYAASTPPYSLDSDSAIRDSVNITIAKPILTANAWPLSAKQGDRILISGKATGRPGSGIAIWVIGPDYSARSVVEPDEKGSYSMEIDSSAVHLVPGAYHVFAEHPSVDDRFDFDLNGDYLFNTRIRSNIFTFRGNGRLYGEAAATAFSAAINGPRNDDLIVPAAFSLATKPAAAAIPPGTMPPVNTTNSSGNGSTASAVPSLPGGNAGPSLAGSLPAVTPEKTPHAGDGNVSGTPSVPGGSGSGGLQDALLAGTLGIVLIGGAGGTILLYRKRRGESGKNGKSLAYSPFSPGAKRDQDLTRAPGTSGTGTALPEILKGGSPASPANTAHAFPEELADKYTGISPVGSGGFAMVYSAYRTSDGRKVAVKIPIRSNERTGKSFLHEIKVWETLHHPNIVEVLATNILPVPYVEMEYVAGSLERLAKPIDPVTAARIVRGITEGIRYAHQRRCIHRDIKPQNILLTEEMIPKITDWGISKVLEDPHKKTTVAGFSLAYAAPEQIAPEKFGGTDERTDIYQIGLVFYELVTGLTLFNDESMMEMVSQITREDPLLISDINPDALAVEKIIVRCLAKNKNQRYQSAGDLLDALTGYLDTVAWGLFEDDS